MSQTKMTAAEIREYIRGELALFTARREAMPAPKVASEDDWIAFKLGCTAFQARRAITWAEA